MFKKLISVFTTFCFAIFGFMNIANADQVSISNYSNQNATIESLEKYCLKSQGINLLKVTIFD